MSRYAIEANKLGRIFRLGGGRPVRAHEMVERTVRKALGLHVPAPDEAFWALRNCSFQVARGEVMAIVGHNGAGKSVLFKILSRVLKPTTGHAVLRGRVVSLLELGTGFDPDMTGRENIFLNGAILGVSQAQMATRLEEIVEFAGIGRFLDEPMKNYSSGMYSRLAFSAAAHVDADVMLVDEVLSVGDKKFGEKCVAHIQQAAANGATILFISHALELVDALCTRCLVLEHGELVFDGAPQAAIQRYTEGLNAGLDAVDDVILAES
jgi:lipopolysaccharide transport system ATP-binding protein